MATKYGAQIQKFSTNLRGIERTRKSILHDPELYEGLSKDTEKMLRHIINRETAGLQWGEGKQKDNKGVVKTIMTPKQSSVRVEWSGDYIRFIEYGAGKPAVTKPYEGDPPINYAPSDEKHRLAISGKFGTPGAWGRNWSGYTNKAWYISPSDTMKSFGWEPIAPFYKTMFAIRMFGYKRLGYTAYEKAVGKVVRKAWNALVKAP